MTKWVLAVAWNEVQGEWRRQARVDFGDLPERPGGPDPAVVVEGRIDLDAAIAGWTRLTEAERGAIRAALVDERAPPERPQAKMRRHRARQRLANLVSAPLRSSSATDRLIVGLPTSVTPRP